MAMEKVAVGALHKKQERVYIREIHQFQVRKKNVEKRLKGLFQSKN